MHICIVGGIFDKPADYRDRHSISPETVLADGLRQRGWQVTPAGHAASLRNDRPAARASTASGDQGVGGSGGAGVPAAPSSPPLTATAQTWQNFELADSVAPQWLQCSRCPAWSSSQTTSCVPGT